MKEEPFFLKIEEFAKELRVHPNTIRNMIISGRLSAFKTNNKKNCAYRIARSEITRLQEMDLEKYIHEKALEITKGMK